MFAWRTAAGPWRSPPVACSGCENCAAGLVIPYKVDDKLCLRCFHYACPLAPWARGSKR